jgi:hypothetical protein
MTLSVGGKMLPGDADKHPLFPLGFRAGNKKIPDQ